jgi:hypothetical protein
MRALVLVMLVGCGGGSSGPDAVIKPDLSGDYVCGSHICHSNQVCVTETAGHTCWTNDAGVGEYGIHDQYCEDVPPECNGVPSCDCIACEGLCFGASGSNDRDVGCGCF